MENFISQFVYVWYVVPLIACFIYLLFKDGIQGEKRADGTIVEEPSAVVRIIILFFIIGGFVFFPFLLFGTDK